MSGLKTIDTGGIGWLDELGDGLYWGMDYTSGDLYEAFDLYWDGHRINKNRLIFVRYPEGAVFEPVKAEDGQYLGRPVVSGGSVYCLLVDFRKEEIVVLRCWEALDGADEAARLPLSCVKDCYNLMLHNEPLFLSRQGFDDDFQVVWPEQGSFTIDPRESLDSRDGDILIFSIWFEDPDYREEFILRRYPDGKVLCSGRGSVMTMPGGEKWVLE